MTEVRPRRIGLVVDHPLRDLHGLALVAHQLAQRGDTAILISFYGQSFDLALLDLDVLVLNYLRSNNLRVFREAQRRGIALVILDTEGGLLPQDGPLSPAGMAEVLRRSDADLALSLYMFWGSAVRDVLTAQSRLDPARAVITGCPRFDLAHDPWASRQGERNIVLVNTNFPLVNSGHARDGSSDRGALRAVGYNEAAIEEIIALNRAVMHDVTEAVAAIADARPERRFVLRPHPFERDTPYRERFAAVPNLEILREGSVLDILAQSCCLLHVNCTTAIEATMCGVPPISLDFANRPEMLRFAALPSQVSHRAASLDEALEMIDRAGELGQPEGIDAIEPFFGPSDGHAAQRVVDALVGLALKPARERSGGRPDPKQAALTLAGRTIGSAAIEKRRWRRHPERRLKAVDEAELRTALDRYAAAQGIAPARLNRVRTPTGMPSLSFEVRPAA